MSKGKKQVHYMPRNGSTYQEQQREKVATMMSIAMECGEQRVIDFLTCVLHDPAIMGKDTFGEKRINDVIRGIKERDLYYSAAFNTDDVESDVNQDELDRELAAALGDITPFAKRYPMIKQVGYTKPKKDWVK